MSKKQLKIKPGSETLDAAEDGNSAKPAKVLLPGKPKKPIEKIYKIIIRKSRVEEKA